MRRKILALLTAASMFVCASPAYVKAAGKHRGWEEKTETVRSGAEERLEHSRRWSTAPPPPATVPAPAPQAPTTPTSTSTSTSGGSTAPR